MEIIMLRKFTSASALSLFMAVSAGLWAVPAVSAPVSFGFAVPLLVDDCPDRYVCGGVGRIWVTLELDDLRTDSMLVGSEHLVAGAVLFPYIQGDVAAIPPTAWPSHALDDDTSFSGMYSYDAVTGTATLDLLAYSACWGCSGPSPVDFPWYSVLAHVSGWAPSWMHEVGPGGYDGVAIWSSPASRLSAVALVGPAVVPVPAAVYLFMSALAGLVGVKRFARKS
jgi:hypothetical protein